MTQIRKFLQGKKTYLSAAALALAAILGWYFGYIDGTQATAMLATAGIGAGLGAKSNRVAQDLMAGLTSIRYAQVTAAQQHKPVDVKQLAGEVAKHVASEVIAAVANNTVVVPVAASTVVGTTAVSGAPPGNSQAPGTTVTFTHEVGTK
jgi:hypothetical protein